MNDLIDANVIIDANAHYYSMEFCPGFWDWLSTALADGSVALIPAVRDELTPRSPLLSRWLREDARVSAPAIQTALTDAHQTVRAAIQQMDCTLESRERFLAGADFQLVSYAVAGNHRVVTRETPEDPRKQKKRLKIPDLCGRLSVPCIGPFQMLREHGVRLEWARS